MATGAEKEAAAAAPKWEVGPTEDVIQAFIETLVDPILPSSVSINNPPSDDAQKSVSKQMHAVVLLYNYYHRNQKPDLKFLDFVSFCKLAMSLRTSLIAFMKFTKEGQSTAFDGDESRLSVTEKAIKEACDITMALDASKDFPITEGCPISKVAVLLIDSKRENCLLQFGAVTKGVWSLIEKEISDDISQEGNVGSERKTKALDDDSKFLQLGCDAVKDITGFDSSDLGVLETHVTYSLSKEKSAVKFYMIQCSQTLNTNQTAPLSFLVDSLQGPLADKYCDSWSTTTIIEYYQMLPYLTFISSWLPRKKLCIPIVIQPARSSVPSALASSNDRIDENIVHESHEDNQKKIKPSSGGQVDSSVNIFLSTAKKDGNSADESNKKCDNLNSAKRDTIRSKRKTGLENPDNNSVKRRTRSVTKSLTEGHNNAVENLNKRCDNVDTGKKGLLLTSQNTEMNGTSNDGNYECPKVSSISKTTLPESEDNNNTSKKINTKIGIHRNISSAHHDPDDDANLKEYDDMSMAENPLVRFEVSNNTEVKNEQDSEDLQNALALLCRKRQELCSQICTMEDGLAVYEDRIERIRDGGEVGLARRCIESIITGNTHLLLKNDESNNHDNLKSKKQTRLPDIFLPGRSSCQDLEYICVKNNWRLPKYFVGPSNGKFVSNVAVGSKDLKLSSEGGAESTPLEARESAAAQMIAKIRNRFCVDER